MTQNHSIYKYRLLARFIIESESVLALGSGESDIISDALVMRDANGLPYIPGTSIAGVVRSILNVKEDSPLWGYQIKDKGKGSEIIFTDAKIIGSNGKVVDGLVDPEILAKDKMLMAYSDLPVRQHVSITEKGVTAKTGKFDSQVVFKGTQFCFEIEIVSTKEDVSELEELIHAIRLDSFRIGGGTRKGYGKIKVNSVKTEVIDLSTQMERYLSKSSCLTDDEGWWSSAKDGNTEKIADDNYTKYTLHIRPVDFFIFGSGYGDESGDADMTGVTEHIISEELKVSGKKVLIPATSVKGAIRHRVAFHYNKQKGQHYGIIGGEHTSENKAVQALFGYQDSRAHKGNIFISDVYLNKNTSHLIHHVCIDRFTGGALKGALFAEKPNYSNEEFELEILVKNDVLDSSEDNPVKQALEMTMNDICKGLLPLGGSVNRGNGIFTGSYTKE